jgi:hypothetical protein
MAFKVADFKAGLRLGGARPSLFEVTIQNPGYVRQLNNISVLCRAAEIPAATIGTIDVQYFGRAVRYAGNRTFADWTVTVLNDEDFYLRDAFEAWSNGINTLETNVRIPPANLASADRGYKTTATVIQYGKAGNKLREYEFIGIYPTEVSTIGLDWGNEAIEEFTVAFTYDHWRVKNVSGEAGSSVSVQSRQSSPVVGVTG